jgi:transcriptional regulator with XRE-family HTH domain
MAMNILATIGTNIRKQRNELGWPQEELAHRAKIDRSYLSEIESGDKNPSIQIIDQIAAALGMDVRDLLGGYKTKAKSTK